MISLLLTGATGAASADVDTAPSASPGSTVEVAGSVDFGGVLDVGLAQRVDLCWDAPGCDDLGTTTVSLLNPNYAVDVTIPGDAAAGEHDIFACSSLSDCDSASIEVILDTTPTTTTTTMLTTTTTTLATTTLAPSTTIASTTSITPAATLPKGDPVQAINIVDPDDPDDPECPPEPADLASGDPTPTSIYTPPAVVLGPPPSAVPTPSVAATQPDNQAADGDGPVINASEAPEASGSPLDSPLVFWAVWLAVMVISTGFASSLWWLWARRRKSQT